MHMAEDLGSKTRQIRAYMRRGCCKYIKYNVERHVREPAEALLRVPSLGRLTRPLASTFPGWLLKGWIILRRLLLRSTHLVLFHSTGAARTALAQSRGEHWVAL